MKKLLYLFLLLPFLGIGQVSTGMEQDFDYGLRNLAPQTVTTPTYMCTQGTDGTIGRIAGALIEKTANKSNDLTVWDGTGNQYIGKDGFNAYAAKFAQVSTKTGLLSKADTFNLIPLTNTTLRISAVESAMFWDELFVANTPASSAIKSFAQKDYPLTQLITGTGGNVNITPLTTDGKYIRYLAYDKLGNVYSSATNFISNNTLLQLGFVTVLKSGSSVTFLDGTAGPRNVLAQPALASNTAFDKVTNTVTNVAVGRKANASFSTTNGTITGISVNWKSAANPTNSDPIDVFNYIGQTTAAFVAIDPTFLTSTSAITTHTLLTELDGGIAVNESFYNTTTGLRGTMANGSAAVARIMVGIRGGIFWQMGEFSSTACYADLATAKSNIYSHVFSEAIVPPGVAYEIARVAFTKGVTATNNDTQFYLINTSGTGGGSSTIPPVSDATTVTKGIVKLAGDLSGTADLPTVPALATKAPITGGTGYIQNQNASPQSANMWISGNGKFDSYITVNSGVNFGKDGFSVFYNALGDFGHTFYSHNGSTRLLDFLANGNVLIGTTTDNGSKLRVSGGSVTIDNLAAVGADFVPVVSTSTGELTNAGEIATSGVYTPTISGLVNASSPASSITTWTRIGNVVSVKIAVGITSTAANTNTSFNVSLPINRNTTSYRQIGTGTLYDYSTPANVVPAFSETTSATTTQILFKSPAVAGAVFNGVFMIQYIIE